MKPRVDEADFLAVVLFLAPINTKGLTRLDIESLRSCYQAVLSSESEGECRSQNRINQSRELTT